MENYDESSAIVMKVAENQNDVLNVISMRH